MNTLPPKSYVLYSVLWMEPLLSSFLHELVDVSMVGFFFLAKQIIDAGPLSSVSCTETKKNFFDLIRVYAWSIMK